MRRLAASTSQAAATCRPPESHATRATGATRTTPIRRSSARSSSGASSAVSCHQPLGTAASASVAAAPACPSACRGGRSASRAVSGTASPESPASTTLIRPPSLDQGCAPVITSAMPTLGGGGASGRPTRTGAPARAGEIAVAWRSLSSTTSPGRLSEATTSRASVSAVPRSSR
jgi:hypothetical protein